MGLYRNKADRHGGTSAASSWCRGRSERALAWLTDGGRFRVVPGRPSGSGPAAAGLFLALSFVMAQLYSAAPGHVIDKKQELYIQLRQCNDHDMHGVFLSK